MSNLLRREVPIVVASLSIGFLFFDYYIQNPYTTQIVDLLREWAVILAAFAAGVGVLNVLLRSVNSISRRAEYWYLDTWMIVIMVIVVVFGLINPFGLHPNFNWIISNIYVNIDASIYAMVMFDIISAFYRTFRVRNIDSTILFIMAFITMVKNAPITGGLFPGLIPYADWFFNIPTGAGARAFLIVSAIGLLSFAVRTALAKEKPTLGVLD
jgi:hypothetical protein